MYGAPPAASGKSAHRGGRGRLALVGFSSGGAHSAHHGEYRAAGPARKRNPYLAILTDSPDSTCQWPGLHRQGVPVVLLVAPQAWPGKKTPQGDARTLRRVLCIFPFEEAFFARAGVPATYIGHPLVGWWRHPSAARSFFGKRAGCGRPLMSVLPGSRRGEAARHLPRCWMPSNALREQALNLILPASATTGPLFRERMGPSPFE